MWWSRRACLLLLAGCGFTPAYGVKSPARALFGAVALTAPTNRDEFDFVAALEAQLGRASAPSLHLDYRITTASEGAGITVDGATTRYILTGTVVYTLSRDGQRVAGGTVDSFTAWSATGSTVAGVTASAGAHRRLMQGLADLVMRRLTMDLA